MNGWCPCWKTDTYCDECRAAAEEGVVPEPVKDEDVVRLQPGLVLVPLRLVAW